MYSPNLYFVTLRVILKLKVMEYFALSFKFVLIKKLDGANFIGLRFKCLADVLFV